jgi:hypothetical protein
MLNECPSTNPDSSKWDFGGATGARTPDLLHAMQMLSQLSYRPERARILAAKAAGTA